MKKRLTPIIAFSSDIVTCFALSTALATCCWCCKPCYHYRVVVTLDRKIVRHTCQTESQRLTSCARNGSSWTIIAFNLLAISVCKWNANVIDEFFFKLSFQIVISLSFYFWRGSWKVNWNFLLDKTLENILRLRDIVFRYFFSSDNLLLPIQKHDRPTQI